MERYDVIVIGAGPSGYAAAMRAIDFRKKVLLVEKKLLGGTGIYHGALSSKAWWELSKDAYKLRLQSRRLNFQMPQIAFRDLKIEVETAVKERAQMLEHQLDNINIAIGEDLFCYMHGHARLLDDHTVHIEGSCSSKTVCGDHIILATGSRPRLLPHIPVDEKIIITSDGFDEMEEFPESLVILGAGVVGCEFATILSNFGRTKVHLIDKEARILPHEDEDVAKIIEKNLEEKGVLIHRNSTLVDMHIEEGKVCYTLRYSDGSKELFRVQKAMISVGRVANVENLFDPSIPIKTDHRGVVNHLASTTVKNIFAVGDLTADIALVNVGELEGRFVIENIFSRPKKPLCYENISTIMFLAPEVAGVGLNEQQAQKMGLSYKVVSLDYSCISRAIAMRNTQGFVKILVTNDDKMNVLGMRVVGEHASSAIEAVALLISVDRGIEELAELIHPHPSIIEGIQECVRMLFNKSILKPKILRHAMQCRVYQDGAYR